MKIKLCCQFLVTMDFIELKENRNIFRKLPTIRYIVDGVRVCVVCDGNDAYQNYIYSTEAFNDKSQVK